jgi:hypothetical protein
MKKSRNCGTLEITSAFVILNGEAVKDPVNVYWPDLTAN